MPLRLESEGLVWWRLVQLPHRRLVTFFLVFLVVLVFLALRTLRTFFFLLTFLTFLALVTFLTFFRAAFLRRFLGAALVAAFFLLRLAMDITSFLAPNRNDWVTVVKAFFRFPAIFFLTGQHDRDLPEQRHGHQLQNTAMTSGPRRTRNSTQDKTRQAVSGALHGVTPPACPRRYGANVSGLQISSVRPHADGRRRRFSRFQKRQGMFCGQRITNREGSRKS